MFLSAFTYTSISFRGVIVKKTVFLTTMLILHLALFCAREPQVSKMVEASLTTDQAFEGGVPALEAFSAEGVSKTKVDLTWTSNEYDDHTLIAYGVHEMDFGTPVNGVVYSINDDLPGGGRVIYYGSETSYIHTGLTPGTSYLYRGWARAMESRQDQQGDWYDLGDYSVFNQATGITIYSDQPGPSWLTAKVVSGTNDILLSWDYYTTWAHQIIHDTGEPTGYKSSAGAFMGTRMGPADSGRILALELNTAGSGTFGLQVYEFSDSSPTDSLLLDIEVPVVEQTWGYYDVWDLNVNFTGDFVVGHFGLTGDSSLGFSGNDPGGRSWNLVDGNWEQVDEMYYVRALVVYDDKIAEYGPDGLVKKHYREGFNVYRAGILIDSVDRNTYTFLDQDMPVGTHTYYVAATFPDDYESSSSNIASATLLAPAAPSDLLASVMGYDVELSWTAPEVILAYTDGTFYSGLGVREGTHIWWVFARFTEQEMGGYRTNREIYRIDFEIYDEEFHNVHVVIEGDTQQYLYQAVNNASGWTTHNLATPFVIPADTETDDLYIGYRVQFTGPSYPAAISDNEGVPQKGFMIYWESGLPDSPFWYDGAYYGNANIIAYTREAGTKGEGTPIALSATNSKSIQKSKVVTNEFPLEIIDFVTGERSSKHYMTGFNVYRNGILIGSVGQFDEEYIDCSVAVGVYDYHVTSVWEMPDRESDPSNTVTVEVLTPPYINVSASSISGSAEVGDTKSGSFSITNDGSEGAIDLTYSISFIYDSYGVEMVEVVVHENDFSPFPGPEYSVVSGTWSAFDDGARTLAVNGNTYQTSVMTSGQFSTEGITDLEISWTQNMDMRESSPGSYCMIEYNNGTGWITVYNTANVIENGDQTATIPVTGNSGQLRFTASLYRQMGGGSYQEFWHIDDILVQGMTEEDIEVPYEWMSSVPVSGTVPMNSSDQINWTMDATGLEEGEYTGFLRITSNAEAPIDIPMSFIVYPPYIPWCISISLVNGNARLSWDPLYYATGYLIFGSSDPYGTFSLLGSTHELYWDYTDVENETKMFFYIIATDDVKAAPITIEVAKPAASSR